MSRVIGPIHRGLRVTDAFRCNICGRMNAADVRLFTRESGRCRSCKSTVRMRSAIYGLSVGLFGKPMAIKDFPKSPRRRGLGLSDWKGYSWRLRDALDYRNTFVHRRPFLDITDVPPQQVGQHDFVLSIDVFEHVPPPVNRAFEGAARLLRPDGILIFSTPYGHDDLTREHFPDLHEFKLLKIFDEFCLVNKTADDKVQIYNNLVFHGGPGHTLEMRFFSYKSIRELMTNAGFEALSVIGDAPEWGIVYDNECSHTIVARKIR